jgi:GMP synthase (glutamine-hydrolysing)
MQTMAEQLGGGVESSEHKEFGYASVELIAQSALFNNVEDSIGDNGNTLLDVWMSHGDKVSAIPDGFITVAQTPSCAFGAIANEAKKFYGVQFHPEVTHTKQGTRILENFVVDICQCDKLWTSATIIEDAIAKMKKQIGDDEVILGLSGGVDSSVVAMLLQRAIGDKLACVFVDNGLLRLDEPQQVMDMFGDHFGLNIIHVNAEHRFLDRMKGEADPEKKRKIIGNVFTEVFDEESKKLENA